MREGERPIFLQKGILNHENASRPSVPRFDHDLAESHSLRERAFEPRERSTAKDDPL